jgi:hypothetical protein
LTLVTRRRRRLHSTRPGGCGSCSASLATGRPGGRHLDSI